MKGFTNRRTVQIVYGRYLAGGLGAHADQAIQGVGTFTHGIEDLNVRTATSALYCQGGVTL